MRLIFSLTIFMLCATGFSGEVLLVHSQKPYIVVSQEKEAPIEVLDRICVVRNEVDIACGNITVSDPKYAIARIDFKHEEIKKYIEKTKDENSIELDIQRPTPVKGDQVRIEQREPKKLIRSLTSELTANNTFAGEKISKERQDELELALKKIEDSRPFKPISILAVGMNFVFPHLQYQQAMSPKWGLGMMAMYMNYSINAGESSLNGPGFFFTYNRYYGGALNGLWWQISPGVFRMTVKKNLLIEGDIYQPVVLATAGWRYFWKEKVNFGFGAGAFYFPFGGSAGGTRLQFSGIIPSLTIDGGITF